ncbi:hypothetical protein C6558_37745 [Ensifer sp. NM-2]|nr:hypothetical protein C6558_37745 [Ensifer sp. NM-2]
MRKWVDRYRCEGLAGLRDRSSRPHRLRRPTPQTAVAEIERLPRQRWTSRSLPKAVSSPATVSRVLRRSGLNKLSALEPAEPIRAMNASTQASSSISIPRSSVGSAPWGTASPGDILAQSTAISASAGSSSMSSASTTPRASLSSRSCPTSARRALSPILPSSQSVSSA